MTVQELIDELNKVEDKSRECYPVYGNKLIIENLDPIPSDYIDFDTINQKP